MTDIEDTQPAPAQLQPIPFWKSRILQSLVISAITRALAQLHLADQFAPADVAMVADDVLHFISYLALGMAFHQRVTLPLPPVTLRKPTPPGEPPK